MIANISSESLINRIEQTLDLLQFLMAVLRDHNVHLHNHQSLGFSVRDWHALSL